MKKLFNEHNELITQEGIDFSFDALPNIEKTFQLALERGLSLRDAANIVHSIVTSVELKYIAKHVRGR